MNQFLALFAVFIDYRQLPSCLCTLQGEAQAADLAPVARVITKGYILLSIVIAFLGSIEP